MLNYYRVKTMPWRDQTMSEEETKTAQILVRISEDERDEWKRAAEVIGVSMSDLIRDTVGKTVHATLADCLHPAESLRNYPWASFCDKCGERLSG